MMREPTLAGVLIAFVVLSLLFGLIERLRPAQPGQRWLRPGYLTDLVYWMTTPLLTRTVTQIGVVLTLLPLFALLGRPLTRDSLLAGWGPLGQWSLPAQAIAIVVLGDFLGYWLHRAFHRGWWWRVHAVHHSSTALDWLASVRVHPLNEMANRVVQAGVLMTLAACRTCSVRCVAWLNGWMQGAARGQWLFHWQASERCRRRLDAQPEGPEGLLAHCQARTRRVKHGNSRRRVRQKHFRRTRDASPTGC